MVRVTYLVVLPMREQTVVFLEGLLTAERVRRGTRADTQVLTCRQQAVLVLRWFLDSTWLRQLATDHQIATPTTTSPKGTVVLAACAPTLESALLAAKAAGHGHLSVDGPLIETDRNRTPGDLRRGPVMVRQARPPQQPTSRSSSPRTAGRWGPSEVRPGRGHDTTARPAHPDLLPARVAWTADGLPCWATLATKANAARSPSRSRSRRAGSSPTSRRPITRRTTASGPSVNALTPCSRPPSKRCATSASAPGRSEGSSRPPSCCDTSNTTGPPDHPTQQAVTQKGSVAESLLWWVAVCGSQDDADAPAVCKTLSVDREVRSYSAHPGKGDRSVPSAGSPARAEPRGARCCDVLRRGGVPGLGRRPGGGADPAGPRRDASTSCRAVLTSLTFPPVVPTLSGSPPSQIRWCVEPGRARSTGDGPTRCPLLPPAGGLHQRPPGISRLHRRRAARPAGSGVASRSSRRQSSSQPPATHPRAKPQLSRQVLPADAGVLHELGSAAGTTGHRPAPARAPGPVDARKPPAQHRRSPVPPRPTQPGNARPSHTDQHRPTRSY